MPHKLAHDGHPSSVLAESASTVTHAAPRESLDAGASIGQAAEIEALQARILACRACQDRGYVPSAEPVRHPWAPRQRIMVVGQAPGAQTAARRYHFAGLGGRILGSWFERAGFPPNSWREQCYMTSLTRCFPGKSPRGRGDRKPSPAELALCHPFLDAELALVRPRLILPVGRMAIDLFLGRGAGQNRGGKLSAESARPLEAVVGTLIERDGRLLLPLPHPSGASSWLNDPSHRALVDRAIALLAQLRVVLGRCDPEPPIGLPPAATHEHDASEP